MVPYKTVFDELERRKIRYLIAGGFAVNFHQVQRATVDLDLILQLDKKNVGAFVGLMEDLGFSPRLPVKAAELGDAEKRKKWIKEKTIIPFSFFRPDNPFETIDIFVNEPLPFNELWSRRFEVSAFGLTLKVLGRDDLIHLKSKTGRDKDEFDVKQLKKIKE